MSAGQRTRVLIVDDSAFMRKVLQSIIAADPQMEVVGEARDGREAVSLNESLQPRRDQHGHQYAAHGRSAGLRSRSWRGIRGRL